MALLRTACHQHYKIPDKELEVTPRILMAILRSRSAKQRTRISAARTLLDLRRFTFEQLMAALKATGVDEEEATKVLRSPFAMPIRTVP